MIWVVVVDPPARKEIRELPDAVKLDAQRLLQGLQEFPIELGDTVLEGHSHLYAARFYRGRYRMVYQVSRKQHRVIVLRARLRETAYEGLEPHWFG